MKQITMMSGRKFIVTDEEVRKIAQMLSREYKGLLGLKSGAMVNVSSIENISDPETVPYFLGNPMNKQMTKVFVKGEWKTFAGDKSQIEHKLISNINHHGESLLLENQTV